MANANRYGRRDVLLADRNPGVKEKAFSLLSLKWGLADGPRIRQPDGVWFCLHTHHNGWCQIFLTNC